MKIISLMNLYNSRNLTVSTYNLVNLKECLENLLF